MTEAANNDAVDIEEVPSGEDSSTERPDADSLSATSLADLHGMAAEAGIARYRLMRREQLVEALGGVAPASAVGDARGEPPPEEPADGPSSPARAGRRRPSRRRGTPRSVSLDVGRGAARDSVAGEADEEEEVRVEKKEEKEEAPLEERSVTGFVELASDGSGSVRVVGFFRSSEDGYLTQGQVRRVGLREGDEVTGTIGRTRRGRRAQLARVDAVNGTELGPDDTLEGRPRFEELTAVAPSRRLPLDRAAEEIFARSVDLVSPQGYGQRTLVTGPDAAGVSSAVRRVARAACTADGSLEPFVLIVDRPAEEGTAWTAEIERARIVCVEPETGGARAADAVELLFARAKRRAEAGADVLVAVDSFGALAPVLAVAAAGTASSQVGRSALRSLVGFFRSGRDLREEGAGSLTMIAGVAVHDSVPSDRELNGALLDMASSSIVLASGWALDPGDEPLLDIARCRTLRPGGFLGPEDISARAALRGDLMGLDPGEACARLMARLAGASPDAGIVVGV